MRASAVHLEYESARRTKLGQFHPRATVAVCQQTLAADLDHHALPLSMHTCSYLPPFEKGLGSEMTRLSLETVSPVRVTVNVSVVNSTSLEKEQILLPIVSE